MRILVNYDKSEQAYISVLQHHLRNRRLEAIATHATLSISELLDKASSIKAQAIFLCNPFTLANLVVGEKPTLDEYRGSVLRYDIPVVVGNSLIHTQTVDHGAWLLGRDLDKLITSTQRKPIPFSYTVLLKTADFTPALRILETSILTAIDIETITVGGTDKETLIEDGRIVTEMPVAGETLISCCTWSALLPSGKIVSYVLPLIDFGVTHWETDFEYISAINFLREANKTIAPKVMHNGMYDATHLICYHAEPTNWIIDTMGLAHAEFVSLPKTLDFVASLYIYDYIQWKTESKASSKAKDINGYWTYNAKDGFNTLRIAIEQLKSLPPYARTNYARQFPLVYPSLYCNFEGFAVSIPVRNQLRAKALDTQTTALKRLRTMVASEDFNPGSWQQVAHIVYDIFGATDPRIGWKKVAGKRTKCVRGTDEKNLRAVGEQHPLLMRLTDAILTYKEQQKAIGTYFDYELINGRLHWNLNPFGTETNRFSCNSSSWWCGTQVQNIPPYAKGMLIADEGFELIEADQSQSDARGTAYLSQDLALIAALETKDKDFYTSLGTLFFGIPYDSVSKDFRNAVLKRIVHGTNFMMGAATFVENAGVANLLTGATTLNIKISMSVKPEAGSMSIKAFGGVLLEAYHKPFFRVREWYSEVKAEIRTTKMLKSPSGHVRYFFGDIDKKYQIFSSAVAHGPQHLTGAILNIGFKKIWKLQKEKPTQIRMKAQIHDSFLGQRKATITVEDILSRMRNPIVIHRRTLLVPITYKLGSNWADMKEYK